MDRRFCGRHIARCIDTLDGMQFCYEITVFCHAEMPCKIGEIVTRIFLKPREFERVSGQRGLFPFFHHKDILALEGAGNNQTKHCHAQPEMPECGSPNCARQSF